MDNSTNPPMSNLNTKNIEEQWLSYHLLGALVSCYLKKKQEESTPKSRKGRQERRQGRVLASLPVVAAEDRCSEVETLVYNFRWPCWFIPGCIQLPGCCFLVLVPDRAHALATGNESRVNPVFSTGSQNSPAGSWERGLVRWVSLFLEF